MSEIVRHKNYDFADGKSWRIKKWSTAKLLTLVGDLGAIFDEALGGITETASEFQIVSRLVVSLCRSQSRAVRLIQQSVDDPPLKPEQVLELDPEDFVGVLTMILELNLTEGLGKKFQGLLGVFGKTTLKEGLPAKKA